MRIATNMMSYNFLNSLNTSLEQQNKLQEQLTDGRAIHRPSDDPVKASRDLRYQTNLGINTQYTQNLQDAQSWMNTTDGAMSDLSSVMIKINELVVSADDTKPQDALNTIGHQIDELINQVVQIGNTQLGDRYVFGGENDTTQPFVRTTIQDPQSGLTKEVVIYNGDDTKLSMPIKNGAADPTQDSVNLTGVDVFGPAQTTFGRSTLSVLNHLLDIKNELTKTSTISQSNSGGGIGTVGGTYTGVGYQNYDVRIDSVTGGVVDGASVSMDGGNTWTSVPAANLTVGSATGPTVIDLGQGVTFSIAASSDNTAHTVGSTGDVYSFRVPQATTSVQQSNSAGGAASVTGTYTKTEATNYSVRVTGVDATGQITGAEFTTDQGTTWTAVPSLTAGNPAVVGLTNGIQLNIAADTDNATGDTYSFQVPQNTQSDVKWLSGVATNYVLDDHNMQLKAQTKLGTRMSMYEMAASMMANQSSVIQTDIASNGSIDIAKAITDFNTSQTLYRAALAVGGRIMPPSLVDFLS